MKKMTKFHVILSLVMIITFTLSVINFFKLAHIQKSDPDSDLTSAFQTLRYIENNLATSPITAIKLHPANSEESCDEGYAKASIGTFQGTTPACFCNGDQYDRIDSSCSFFATGCQTVKPLFPEQLFAWNGVEFCVKRVETHNYRVGNCADGFKKCGSYLCVLADEECPISEINIAKTENGVKFSISQRNDTNNYYVSLFTSLNDLPCLNSFVASQRLNGIIMPYVKREIGCEVRDTDTQILDKQPESLFYDTNSISYFLNTLPLYEASTKDQTINLVGRLAIRFAPKDNFESVCANAFRVSPTPIKSAYSYYQESTASFATFGYVVLGIGSIIFLCSLTQFFLSENLVILSILIAGNSTLYIVFLSGIVAHRIIMNGIGGTFGSETETMMQVGAEGCYLNEELNKYIATVMPTLKNTFNDKIDEIRELFVFDVGLVAMLLIITAVFFLLKSRARSPNQTPRKEQKFARFEDDSEWVTAEMAFSMNSIS